LIKKIINNDEIFLNRKTEVLSNFTTIIKEILPNFNTLKHINRWIIKDGNILEWDFFDKFHNEKQTKETDLRFYVFCITEKDWENKEIVFSYLELDESIKKILNKDYFFSIKELEWLEGNIKSNIFKKISYIQEIEKEIRKSRSIDYTDTDEKIHSILNKWNI
jgi:hypothetical protein